MPVKLVLGRMKRLYIKVPWNALSSVPVQLQIHGLELVMAPLTESDEWHTLITKKNRFETLQKALLKCLVKKLKERLAELKKQASKGAQDADQGFFVNLTSKVVDNIQISIKNIHIRFEDAQLSRRPLSMGITLQEFEVNTTNENWSPEFIDRTLAKNQGKPLQKMLTLRNLGFYCNPSDESTNMICEIESVQERFERFRSFFPEGASSANAYQGHYILEPISVEAKLKQLTGLAKIQHLEPQYQLQLAIDNFQVSFKKSQFEAVLKFLSVTNDFQMEQESVLLNLRKENLGDYYQDAELFASKLKAFKEGVLQQLTKEVTLLSLEGSKISRSDQARLESEAEMRQEVEEAYHKFVQYENMVLLKSWGEDVLDENFTQLENIMKQHHQDYKKEEAAADGGIVKQVGSWLWKFGGKAEEKPKEEGKGDLTTEGDEGEEEIGAEEIARMSQEIYENLDKGTPEELKEQKMQKSADVPKFQACFQLGHFRVSLIDEGTQPNEQDVFSDLFDEYQYNEVEAFSTNLEMTFSSFDQDDINNLRTGELRASLADMGVNYT